MARLLAVPFAAMLALLLTACSRGPDTVSLHKDLQSALDLMDTGLMRIVALNSQGTGPGAVAGELVSYANVTLELQRDHDFGSWDGPTVGTLASTLGATAKGVRGLKQDGNVSGDRLEVYASAVYAQDGDGWRYLGGGAPASPATITPTAENASLVRQLETIFARGQANDETPDIQLIERELTRALEDIQQQIAEAESGAIVAGGPVGGEYARIALGLSALAEAHGMRLAVYHSDGSVENARLVQSSDVALSLVQSDVLALAYTAEGPFAADEPLFNVVALAALYPEIVHLIVPADSTIDAVGDLAGKRVALGAAESGTRLSARRVLAAHGMQLTELGPVDSSDFETAAEQLARGEVDAMFVTIGAPAEGIRRLAARRAVRLVPLDEAAISELTAQQRSYVRHSIPVGTYRGQVAAVRTVATTAVLVAPRTIADSIVDMVLNAIFFEFDYEAVGSFQGRLISPQTATKGLPLPLHLAAQRYFADLAQAR